MKEKLLVVISALLISGLLAFHKVNNTSSLNRNDRLTRINISCSTNWNNIQQLIDQSDIPYIPGAGKHRWKISTTNDSAQAYFNQGINMYYSFHILEAMASFKKAARFDPNAAMLQWAQALAYGPNINDLGYTASPEALATSSKAVELSVNATEKEKIIIQAQQIRYSNDSTLSRQQLNQLYADKMKEAYQKFPGDPDIAALYADALMLQHPWDLWNINGTPKPWTPAIREVLEKLLAKSPEHPGANHYYIHVMEASPFAEKALASADRLGRLTPALSHTVHMPSHIYLRTGHYTKGVSVNIEAIKSYKKMLTVFSPATENAFLYSIHNLHMQANNAMMTGKESSSVLAARETVEGIPPDYLDIPGAMGSYIHYISMTPTFVAIRFGKWNDLLNFPAPPATQVYRRLLFHFGKGMAYSKLGKQSEAEQELSSLRFYLKDTILKAPINPFSPALDGAIVAEQLLKGTIALNYKNYPEAIQSFEKAVETEQNMVYNEPRDWLLNPKQFLGDAYIKAGKYNEAIATFKMDLLTNKNNGWALYGLSEAYRLQGKKQDALKTMAEFKRAFNTADVKPTGAVF